MSKFWGGKRTAAALEYRASGAKTPLALLRPLALTPGAVGTIHVTMLKKEYMAGSWEYVPAVHITVTCTSNYDPVN